MSLLYRGAEAAEAASSDADERVLVVVQMSGGNDGINTLVPFEDEGYAKHRQKLFLPTERLIKISDSLALHPSMRSAADLLEDGKLTIVQGVGCPNPSRSHDASMAIWHSAQIGDEDTRRTHGWIGRAMDAATDAPNSSVGDDPPMILLGDESQPLAIRSRRSTAITLSNLADLRLKTPLKFATETEPSPPETLQLKRFIQQTMRNATVAATS
ncbi:MAG: Twin-arginine translocation pathway signal sequence domain protein, partial [Pirellula sp.]